ncbi:MAG: hypothetical protein ABJA74_04290 [Lapillicoccus sp.]
MTQTYVSSPPARSAATGVGSWLPPVVALLVSAGAVVLGLAAGRSPGDSALTRTDGPMAASLLPPVWLATLVTLTGAAGLVGVLVSLATPARRARWALTAVFVATVAVLGFGLGSISSIALAGYLVTMAMPVVLVVLVVQAVRRYRRVRWVALGSAAAFVVWALLSASLRPESLQQLGAGLVTGFATGAPRLLVAVLSTAATASFGLLLLVEVRGTDAWTRAGASIARHRMVWTLVAACCALPYGLVRMTWFTPWPVLGQSEDLSDEMRLWGLLLGSGAILGFVLTLGLVRPWGEPFPRWMPRLAGRPVPVPAAAVPGGIVAAVLLTSALPMLHDLSLTDAGIGLGVDSVVERVAMALVFPLWLWGPMLGLAVWGYVGHRRRDPGTHTGVRPTLTG